MHGHLYNKETFDRGLSYSKALLELNVAHTNPY